MSRVVGSGLQALLDKTSCNTQTTLSLYLADGTTEYHFATIAGTINSETFTADLRRTDDVRQSIGAVTDRVRCEIQNVDKVIGGYVTDEDLVKAVAVIGRYFRDEQNLATAEWIELFRGQSIPLEVNESVVILEVVSDLIAAGYCVGNWPLSENCVFVFKHAGTCGYSGGETACNKKRRSKAGCAGRNNEHHFGGMEFPDPQIPSTPSGGEPPDGGGFPGCPRLDQYVLARGESEFDRVAKPVRLLKRGDQLWNPLDEYWDRVISAEILTGQKIWAAAAANGSEIYSSDSHPLLHDRADRTGTAVRYVRPRQPVLTWSKQQLADSVITTATEANIRADVMKITLERGHIYCAGSRPDQMIVCHNSKLPIDL